MDDAQAVARVAREYVEQLGVNAPADLRERASVAEGLGDQLSADAWRDIADAAERILRS